MPVTEPRPDHPRPDLAALALAHARHDEEQRLLHEARELRRVRVALTDCANRVRGPLLDIRSADGPEVWSGRRADRVRLALDELDAALVGSPSVRTALEDVDRTLALRIEAVEAAAREAGRQARAALAG